MSVCWTVCRDCGFSMNHKYLDKCEKCQSSNVDRDKEYGVDDGRNDCDDDRVSDDCDDRDSGRESDALDL